MIPPMYDHQAYTANFWAENPRVLNTSDPGTGKTRGTLEGYGLLKMKHNVRRMLVLAPLSILQPAWGDDIEKWTPWFSYGISIAGSDKKRRKAFDDGCDIVITNHDAVKWLLENKQLLRDFDVICIDESTAYKNGNSQRSKAVRHLVDQFEYRVLLSGTMMPNGVLDAWHQALITDDGERLGKKFVQFRNQVTTPVQVAANAHAIRWDEKPGAVDMVADKLRDITVRFRLEDCIDMPENVVSSVYVDLPKKVMDEYRTLEKDAILFLQSGNTINAVHAGAKVQKLLQLCSGAVYDADGTAHTIHMDRYKLVIDLVQERTQSVVAFLWKHQKEALCSLADKAKITYAVIDGSTPAKDRTAAVRDFQAGRLQVIFAHPQSAGHGLTLTNGVATIWASPTYNAEHFAQFNARIYRAGQKQRTETILITASGTWEEQVYARRESKITRMDHLLEIFADETRGAA